MSDVRFLTLIDIRLFYWNLYFHEKAETLKEITQMHWALQLLHALFIVWQTHLYADIVLDTIKCSGFSNWPKCQLICITMHHLNVRFNWLYVSVGLVICIILSFHETFVFIVTKCGTITNSYYCTCFVSSISLCKFRLKKLICSMFTQLRILGVN